MTRFEDTFLDIDTEFPKVKMFSPTIQMEVGMVMGQLEAGELGNTVRAGSLEVVKELEAKWFHDNVYYKSRYSI